MDDRLSRADVCSVLREIVPADSRLEHEQNAVEDGPTIERFVALILLATALGGWKHGPNDLPQLVVQKWASSHPHLLVRARTIT